MTIEQFFDVIVCGAGPAGSTAARKCAEQGLKTILIDKERVPRPKICAGAVSVKALNLVGEEIPEHLNERYIKGLRFFSPSLKSVEIISKDPLAVSVSRDEFDAFLISLASREGCTFLDSDAVADVSILGQKVICRLESGRLIESQMIIGADGVTSVVARKTGIRERWENDQVGLCLETRISLSKHDLEKVGNICELYLIDIPLGYGWVLPKRASISLGIGGCLAYLRNPQKLLVSLCRTVSRIRGFDLKVTEFGAHLVPAGGFERKLHSERTMLIGDAAGFVDPLTGEGIYYAMKSGVLAALACKRAAEQQDTSSEFLEKHYSKACKKEFGKDLGIALELTYSAHENCDLLMEVLESASDSVWVKLARGETTYGALRRSLLPSMVKKLIVRKARNIVKRMS